MFTEKFGKYTCDGDSISCEVDGFKVTARIVRDDSGDAPWDNDCMFGGVSKWTTRNKRPGERTLCEDRGSRRFYDFAGQVAHYRREGGWGGPEFEGMTPGQKAAASAERSFKVLRAWVQDEWWYVGVSLKVSRNGVTLAKHAASLWGIECNYPDSDNSYLTEVANELLSEALDNGREALAAVCDCGGEA